MFASSIPTVECKTEGRGARGPGGRPAPLLRSRTLPAIVAPGLSILQAQIDARYVNNGTLINKMPSLPLLPSFSNYPSYLSTHRFIYERATTSITSITAASTGLSVPPTDGASSTKRASTASHCRLLAPRISFTDDTIGKGLSAKEMPINRSRLIRGIHVRGLGRISFFLFFSFVMSSSIPENDRARSKSVLNLF